MHLFGYLEIYFFISLFRITIQSDFGLKFCMVFWIVKQFVVVNYWYYWDFLEQGEQEVFSL